MIGLEGQDPLSRLLDAKLRALRPLPVVQTRVSDLPDVRSMVEAGEALRLSTRLPHSAPGSWIGRVTRCHRRSTVRL